MSLRSAIHWTAYLVQFGASFTVIWVGICLDLPDEQSNPFSELIVEHFKAEAVCWIIGSGIASLVA